MVCTSTASGKSLCYNLPILEALVKDPRATALYMFPTKALAQDQLRALRELCAAAFGSKAPAIDIYDGDTPQVTTQQGASVCMHGLLSNIGAIVGLIEPGKGILGGCRLIVGKSGSARTCLSPTQTCSTAAYCRCTVSSPASSAICATLSWMRGMPTGGITSRASLINFPACW